MFPIKFFIWIIIVFVTCITIDAINTNYCVIERMVCYNLTHPLCQNLGNSSSDQYRIFDDTEVIVSMINKIRNNVAAGNFEGLPTGSNLRVVRSSTDYAELLKAKLLNENVCTEISLTRQFVIEKEEFVTDDSNAIMKNVEKEVSSGSRRGLLRAEFNRIGCVYDNYDTYKIVCYVNRLNQRVSLDSKNLKNELYSNGPPCSKCVNQCSDEYKNLCDDSEYVPEQQQPDVGLPFTKRTCYVSGMALIAVVFIVLLLIVKRQIVKFRVEGNKYRFVD